MKKTLRDNLPIKFTPLPNGSTLSGKALALWGWFTLLLHSIVISQLDTFG